jgi:hypothetical protein
MMRRYDEYGMLDGPASQAEIDRIAEKVRLEDEARQRHDRAWARLCGIAPMIGGPSGR